MCTYWEQRRYRNQNYYNQTTEFVRRYAPDATSVIDIGNRGCEYIYEWDWIGEKTVLDVSGEIYRLNDTVWKVQEDFLTWQPTGQYDLVTCLQTLEHIRDPVPFVKKLRDIQKDILIVSLPYMWSACKAPDEHQHDPMDLEMIHAWLGKNPLEEKIVAEARGTERWIGVYRKPAGRERGHAVSRHERS